MLKHFNITRFGCFADLSWAKSLGNARFKYLNLIYGRNYSGKTTISRILRSAEVGEVPEKFESAKFQLSFDSTEIDEQSLAACPYDIRVYNRDFARANLSFLHDELTGEIKPFAVVGASNNEIQAAIEELEKRIGDESSGLSFELVTAQSLATQHEQALTSARSDFDNKLRAHAVEIKNNRVFGRSVYNIDTIRKEIERAANDEALPLDQDAITELGILIKEEALAEIPSLPAFPELLKSLAPSWLELVSRKIAPSMPLQALLNDAVLQSWVKAGIGLHRDKRDSCGFCGNPIPSNLWSALDAHFDKQSAELTEALQNAQREIESTARTLKNWLLVEESLFYNSSRQRFADIKARYDAALEAHLESFAAIRQAVGLKLSDVFADVSCPVVELGVKQIDAALQDLTALVASNNARTTSLFREQEQARDSLRLNNVLDFSRAIDFEGTSKLLEELAQKGTIARAAVLPLRDKVAALRDEISALRRKQDDESAAADKVNHLLARQFGIGGLKLVSKEATQDSGAVFFVFRGDAPAFNLSEGECSLIAFCYYLAKLDDVLTSGRKPILFIDDPISSLDSNHIFFLFGLMEENLTSSAGAVGAPYVPRFQQIFVSTHSLEFFKYLKRLSAPKDEKELFLIERGSAGSRIRPLPKYMRAYQTEFVYLFHQIVLCRQEPQSEEEFERFFGFGNNLRKFLEAYLFYRYPYHGDNQETRLRRFFGDDQSAVSVTTRISNELSHLEEIFDRSMAPIEIPEIPALANFVVDRIRQKDPDQYDSLMKSIGMPIDAGAQPVHPAVAQA